MMSLRRVRAFCSFVVGLAFYVCRVPKFASWWFSAAVADGPSRRKPRLFLARSFWRCNRLIDAAHAYRELIKIDPRHSPALFELGCVLQELGCHDEAIDFFDRAIAEGGNEPLFHVDRAMSLKALARPGEATEALKRALRIAPNCTPARRQLVISLGEMRLWTEVTSDGLELMSHEPCADVAYHTGVGLWQLGRLGEAKEVLERGLRMEPESVDLKASLANVLSELGEADPAEQLLRDALRNHSDAFLMGTLATVLLKAGRTSEALQVATRAVECEPESPEAHGTLGFAHLAAGDYLNAVRAFQRALAAAPDFHQVRGGLAATFCALERYGDAIAEFDRVLERDPDFLDRPMNVDFREQFEKSSRELSRG